PLRGSNRGADEARKAGAGAEIDPASCLAWREREKLSAVENMTPPQIGRYLSAREKIDALVPAHQKLCELPQPGLRFTWNKIQRNRIHAASARVERLVCASSNVSAAGVMPSIREACPRFSGSTVERRSESSAE